MNARTLAPAALALLAGLAHAQPVPVTLQVSQPTAIDSFFDIFIHFEDVFCSVPLNPGMTATMVRNRMVPSIQSAGFIVDPGPPLGNSLRVMNVPPDRTVRLETHGAGQPNDKVHAPGTTTGDIAFAGHFLPQQPGSIQPAIFTAGIVTDVGELTAQVSAQELNFQTDGPIICQALFQRLAPRAPQYGSQINFAGDRLEVYFDPAYTLTQGGVTFGTTSPSPGCAGSIDLPRSSSTLTIIEGPSYNPAGGSQRLTIGPDTFEAPVPPLGSASMKADCWMGFCGGGGLQGMPAFHTPGSDRISIVDVPLGTPVRFDCLSGADMPVRIDLSIVTGGIIGYEGTFDPIGGTGQPARFTAGIVTDVGELTAQVSAQELNFQTDGPIICQALFQRLAPRAPQYGAQINYAGDRLEVYFDPAYTVTQGGVVFGTSSTSPGCYAELNPPPPPPPCDPDYDQNGVADQDDVIYLIAVIAGGENPTQRDPDFDQNGVADQDDVIALIGVIAGQGCNR